MPSIKRRTVPSFGSISTGTLRQDDLLSAFAYECRTLGGRKGRKLEAEYDRMTQEQVEGEEGEYLLEAMQELLEELAPPYAYFGTLEGDGSDFGFWPSIDSLEDAVRDGSVLKVNDLADIPASYRGEVMLVNDHGNVTFGYAHRANGTGNFKEIWSVV